ncbi:MAG: tRNA lysidine(34) synthetase TilS [Deltaproteobacteria bacterium]|nr:tRNA lysidine(34) synthetase TilS [Deltaproteobacteria bacterium]
MTMTSRNKEDRNALVETVRRRLKAAGMLDKGDTLVCAVSGGVDSMVMLHIMYGLKDEFGLKLVVAHLNHNLRGAESARDCAFVKKAASALGLRCIVKRLKKGELDARDGSLQEAARKSRYAFFEDVARRVKADRVATGHTLDDQAETVLLRLLKGASIAGLGGIPLVRGPYIRPIIDIPRAEIEAYARANAIAFVTDSSNLTDKYQRNAIRHNLIPLIEGGFNPNIKETLARTAGLLRRDNAFIEEASARAYAAALIGRDKHTATFENAKLRDMHPAVLSRVFLSALAELSIERDAYACDVEAFLDIVKSMRPNVTIKAAGVWVTRQYGVVTVSATAPVRAEGFMFALKTPGITVVKEAGFRLKAKLLRAAPASLDAGPGVAYFDYDALPQPIILRPYKPGDRLRPIGMKGSRKIKDIYIDARVPASLRPRIPLLVCGSEIIWAAGVKRSDSYKVLPQTGRVLRVEYSTGS